jgi:hypothetical protein
MSESAAQLERLARRINWLDRYRRALSILLAAIAAPLVMWWVTGQLPSEWPGAHMGAIAFAVAVFAWYAPGCLARKRVVAAENRNGGRSRRVRADRRLD